MIWPFLLVAAGLLLVSQKGFHSYRSKYVTTSTNGIQSMQDTPEIRKDFSEAVVGYGPQGEAPIEKVTSGSLEGCYILKLVYQPKADPTVLVAATSKAVDPIKADAGHPTATMSLPDIDALIGGAKPVSVELVFVPRAMLASVCADGAKYATILD